MITITFTASVIKKDKRSVVAHAEEFPVIAEPASTERGAVKNLKAAVSDHLRKAAETGMLTDFLENAGYRPQFLLLKSINLEPNIYSGETVTIPIARDIPSLDRSRRPSSQ